MPNFSSLTSYLVDGFSHICSHMVPYILPMCSPMFSICSNIFIHLPSFSHSFPFPDDFAIVFPKVFREIPSSVPHKKTKPVKATETLSKARGLAHFLGTSKNSWIYQENDGDYQISPADIKI